MQTLSVHLDDGSVTRLETLCQALGLSQSEVVKVVLALLQQQSTSWGMDPAALLRQKPRAQHKRYWLARITSRSHDSRPGFPAGRPGSVARCAGIGRIRLDQSMAEQLPTPSTWQLRGGQASAAHKRSQRTELLRQAGIDPAPLTSIALIDAALCALATHHLARGRPCCAYGEARSGLIVVPQPVAAELPHWSEQVPDWSD